MFVTSFRRTTQSMTATNLSLQVLLMLQTSFGVFFRVFRRKSVLRAAYLIWKQRQFQVSPLTVRVTSAKLIRTQKKQQVYRQISLLREHLCHSAVLRWLNRLAQHTVMSLILNFIRFLLNIARLIIRAYLMLTLLKCLRLVTIRLSQVFLTLTAVVVLQAITEELLFTVSTSLWKKRSMTLLTAVTAL